MKIWIDIENPPQVQYLLPLQRAFARAGCATVVTARDYGVTFSLLRQAGIDFRASGASAAKGKTRKVFALGRRVRELDRFLRSDGMPDALIAASRAGAVTARLRGIPSFILEDYEYSDLTVYRLTGATVLYSDAIDPRVLRRRGLRAGQLLPFHGFKEDLTFADIPIDEMMALPVDGVPPDVVRVVFRPPSETSHYYRRESSTMARAVLEHLAASQACVVFVPRTAGQSAYLDGLEWGRPPVVLERPVAFLALLLAADLVVCSGGTMLREAAYLGIPAYSILQSRIGGVDLRLRDLGRVKLLTSVDEVGEIELRKRHGIDRLDSNPALLSQLVQLVLATVATGSRSEDDALPQSMRAKPEAFEQPPARP